MFNQRNMKTNAVNVLGKTEHWTRERQIKHSHNIVERRRRLKINYRIKELEALLPDHNVASSTPRNNVAILAATVDYIKQFREKQEELNILEERQRKTEEQIKIILKILSMQQSTLREDAPCGNKASENRCDANYILKGYIPVYENNKN